MTADGSRSGARRLLPEESRVTGTISIVTKPGPTLACDAQERGQREPQLIAAPGAFMAGLPVYPGYVAHSKAENAPGYPLAGDSSMQVAGSDAGPPRRPP